MSEFKNIQELEKRLWDAADELRANTGLTSQEYSRPVLGLIFLRYAEYRFELAAEKMAGKATSRRRGGDNIKTAVQAEGAMYVPEAALFSNLLKLPEDTDLGKAVNDAMKALEAENEAIKDALPKSFTVFDNAILATLLKNFANIRFDIGSDVFGRIYVAVYRCPAYLSTDYSCSA
ncbi:MAG: SAM-dependent DNA methyltransferase [Candidatus Brocadiaceae bacterium]|nr:SAM-dependent DNA methyltransferase [Candidatus Brocadiaceae bacterium]